MARNILKWLLLSAAILFSAICQANAQDVSTGTPVASSYANLPAPPSAPPSLPPDAPMPPSPEPLSPCDEMMGSCNNQCYSGYGGCEFDWDKDAWIKVGAGLRMSFDNIEQHTLTDHRYNFFSPDNARILISGQGNEYIKFTLNTDISDPSSFVAPNNITDVQLLDAIIQFDFNDLVNFWMGRLLPPTDRATLDNVFYSTPYLQPFVSRYPSVFEGRDDGVVYWGQLCGGQATWAVGAFNGIGRNYFPTAANPGLNVVGDAVGPNQDGDLLYASRLQVDLLDPEPGYYTQDSYFGKRRILSLAVVAQYQDHAVNDGVVAGVETPGRSMFASDIELMYEQPLRDCGVVTLIAALYDYQDHHQTNQFAATQAGDAGYVQLSYLTGKEYCFAKLSGHFQPYIRYQRFNYDLPGVAATFSTTAAPVLCQQFDLGVNYLIAGYNARLTADWSQDEVVNNGGHFTQMLLGAQVMF